MEAAEAAQARDSSAMAKLQRQSTTVAESVDELKQTLADKKVELRRKQESFNTDRTYLKNKVKKLEERVKTKDKELARVNTEKDEFSRQAKQA